MKFYKLLAGFGLAVLASVSVNASAQTAACTWTTVYGTGSPSGYATVSSVCKSPLGTQIASRTDIRPNWDAQYTCGTPSIISGYKRTGIYGTGYFPLTCNEVIVAGSPTSSSSSSSSSAIPPITVYPGSSCTWARTGNYMGYDYFDFNCSGFGKIATKRMGYPWSYSSQGYTCVIDAVAPYILIKTGGYIGATECSIIKATKP